MQRTRTSDECCVMSDEGVEARSILRVVERPGRVVAGEIVWRRPIGDGATYELDLAKLDETGPAMRAIRGADIGLVFQEPMTSFSPVHTILPSHCTSGEDRTCKGNHLRSSVFRRSSSGEEL